MWHSVLLSWTHSLYHGFSRCQVKKIGVTMQGNAKGVPQRVGVGVLGSGKIGVENRIGDVDRTLRDSIDSQFRKSPAQGNTTNTNRIHLPCKSC